MNPWPYIVVGLWLLYASYEDWKRRVIDLGVPVAIILTRVAVEGPWWFVPASFSLLPLYLFLKFLENYHRMVIWFNLPGPEEPIWYDGDTYLILSVSLFLGLNSIEAVSFLLGSLFSVYTFYLLAGAIKGKIKEVINQPIPLSPGVLMMYAFTVISLLL
jgi:hypothetical protein